MKFKEFLNLSEGINDKFLFKALFIIGVAASGKSTISSPLKFYAKHIDVDAPQEYFSEKYKIGLDKDDPADGKNQIRKIGTRIIETELENYIDGMLPMVINVVGDDLERTKMRIETLRSIGYDVGMIYINADIENTVKRVAARRYGKNKDLHRHIPQQYVYDSYERLVKNAKVYHDMLYDGVNANRELLDYFIQIQNNGFIGDETVTRIHKESQKFFSSPLKNEKGIESIRQIKDAGGKKLSDVPGKKELVAASAKKWFTRP